MPQTSEGDSNLNDQENTIIDSSGPTPAGIMLARLIAVQEVLAMKSGRPIPKSRATLLNPLLVRRSRQPQQRVDEARIALDRAKSAQLQAALYLSAADDAASTESPSLQELEEALKNATAASRY